MALANFSLAAGEAIPAVLPTNPSQTLRHDLDDLLYSPEQQEYQTGNEPFLPPNQRRTKLKKRSGASYLPPPNQYTHYPRPDIPHNPYNGQLHTQIYHQNPRLDIQIENQRVQEVNQPQYDNTGQYIHDPTGDYDYEQRRLDQNGSRRPQYNPGYADSPYTPATTVRPSSRFDSHTNQNVNNFNFVNTPTTTPSPPPRKLNEAGTKTAGKVGDNLPALERPRGFTKVETGSSGGKTQLHAILDYDDDYYDDVPGTDSGGPAVTPLQGPILLRNGSVPVVPLTAYHTVNNGSFYQIPADTETIEIPETSLDVRDLDVRGNSTLDLNYAK